MYKGHQEFCFIISILLNVDHWGIHKQKDSHLPDLILNRRPPTIYI